MSNADVTAVVACFNYGRFLPEAVGSLLAQEGGAPHVIVVDDGSTDDATLAALDALPDQVDVVRQANAGVCAARNAGLARASTPYVLFLDADDRLVPDALRVLRGPLDADPSLAFTYGRFRFFGAWEGVMRMPPYDPYALLYRHTIGATALTRREALDACGGFDPAFTAFEDWELWVNVLAHGYRGQQVDAVTVEYRRHGASKHAGDRRAYRAAYRQLRAKHAALYRRRRELAAESGMGSLGRALHRFFWGPRPLPARLEAAAHRALWRPRS
jgi:glycosyltransferase involved in cell wall biosynthesis